MMLLVSYGPFQFKLMIDSSLIFLAAFQGTRTQVNHWLLDPCPKLTALIHSELRGSRISTRLPQ